MKILISNDDGVHAPGIRALAQQLALLGEIIVMAPDRNRSGASNSLTLTQPLRVRQLDNGHFCVEGTPTDCVHLALTGYLDNAVDVVVSGINEGANLGDDILYSGTVAAAVEGRYLGYPSLAFSMVGHNIQHYDTGAIIAKQLISKLRLKMLPPQTILNINIPDLPLSEIQGIAITRLGTRHSSAPTIKAKDPRGKAIYWIGPPGVEADAGEGTDFYAVNQKKVSITPLNLDMTHYKVFDTLSAWANSVDWQGE